MGVKSCFEEIRVEVLRELRIVLQQEILESLHILDPIERFLLENCFIHLTSFLFFLARFLSDWCCVEIRESTGVLSSSTCRMISLLAS